MMSLKEIPTKKTDSFVYYFLKSLKKDSKHSLFIHNLRQISIEINYFTKRKKNKVYLELADILRRQKLILIKDYENYLSYILRKYKNEILNVKKYFTKLRLTLGVKKRKYFIKSNKTKFEDKFDELSLSKIEGTKNKFIWEFKGGFWADELGDYAIAIENKCENKKI
jgi:hypothetical protein